MSTQYISNSTNPKNDLLRELESRLHDCSKDISKKNLAFLKKDLENNKIVSFVGAGASVPLGIPSWKKLLSKIYEQAKKQEYKGDFQEDSEKWIEFAEELYDFLEKKDKVSVYENTLINNLKNSTNTSSLSLVKMVLAINRHVTTNFDTSIENAYKFLNYYSYFLNENYLTRYQYTKHYLGNLSTSNLIENSISYLHGNIEDKKFIFRKKEYELFYPSISGDPDGIDWVEKFIEELFRQWNILFVGFSFNDRYIRELLFKIKEKLEKEFTLFNNKYPHSDLRLTKKHYLLISYKKEYEPIEGYIKDFNKINIYPIIYNENEHVFVEKVFEELSLIRQATNDE